MEKLHFKQTAFLLIFTGLGIFLNAQVYEDYIGAGHSAGITVTSSDNHSLWGWEEFASGEKTINGDGLDARLMETSRFLTQAAFGADMEYIKSVAEMDFEDWVDDQFQKPLPIMTDTLMDIWARGRQMFIDAGGDSAEYGEQPYNHHFLYSWWQLNMANEDLLRQRIALSLSEILVISFRDVLDGFGIAQANFYDIFLRNAFGSYLDILHEVALHPAMGVYLSHFNNPKSNPEQNIHPDENFAREVMQLFTIGLYELNQDGSHKTDNDGNEIPTYDNNDIKEFAKVFTGLGPGAVVENEWVDEPYFGLEKWLTDFTFPMAMYDDWHEQGEKHLLNGFVVPDGQSGMQDVDMAIDNLFNHENVGPFIARKLIQSMIKSNPTPSYISRVAAAFNDNGAGERGDMKAVIKAILLDEEARDCSWINDPVQGKLREPMQRYFHFCRAMDKSSPFGIYWNVGYEFYRQTGQAPLGSPSVFNFFLPDFQPSGPIADAELFAPEFQIHNSQSSIGYVNMVDMWVRWGVLLDTWEAIGTSVTLDKTALIPLAKDPQVLIDKLDVLLTHGMLGEETRNIVVLALNAITHDNSWAFYLEFRVDMALYLIMISPDYTIQK
ncbi:MAG: DUF1800 domain-containing protein [Chlorobi bacterium]|nr:DUF1800 domain-containing protein [Chlorobiota bacterium]